jgi:hypothetical protein
MYPRAASLIRPVPLCSQCRYFKNDRCRLFSNNVPAGIVVHTKAEHARDDPFLCGPNGLYFSDKNVTNVVLK